MLAGQTILITGGGSGLGRGMAERFGGLGAGVGVLGPLSLSVCFPTRMSCTMGIPDGHAKLHEPHSMRRARSTARCWL